MTDRKKGRKARRFPASLGFLRSLVTYNPEDGRAYTEGLYNTMARVHYTGYNVLKLPTSPDHMERGKRRTQYYRVDHLAWYLCVGEWPAGWIEHINGIISDDSIENLVHLDDEGRRWWFGLQAGSQYRKLVQVEGDEASNTPLVDVYHEGNEAVIKPRLVGGWLQETKDKLVSVEPAPQIEQGEFGKDWT